MRRATDLTPAAWLAGAPPGAIGPPGFPAYARLRFIPDPVAPGQAEAEVELPEDHPPDIARARRALRVLEPFTATPGEFWFCVWDGYSDLPLGPGPLLHLPYRDHGLYSGTRHDLDGWEAAPPAYVWPADRSWCWSADVDPHWAGIAASRAAVEALLADPELDVVSADPAVRPPHYG